MEENTREIKKKGYEEVGDGIRPGCGGGEKFPSSILRRSKDRYELYFDVVYMFQRGGWPRGKQDYIRIT